LTEANAIRTAGLRIAGVARVVHARPATWTLEPADAATRKRGRIGHTDGHRGTGRLDAHDGLLFAVGSDGAKRGRTRAGRRLGAAIGMAIEQLV